MRTLTVFNNITLDGYFTDTRNDMTLFHSEHDPEWDRFASENAAARRSTLLFGRKTYELMKSYWPTEEARRRLPEVAAGMSAMEKVVFSRTLAEPGWTNARIAEHDPVDEVRRLKDASGNPMLILGSGTIVAQLTRARLIDRYVMVIWPIVLGAGRTLFDGLDTVVKLTKTDEKTFTNGNIVATYEA